MYTNYPNDVKKTVLINQKYFMRFSSKASVMTHKNSTVYKIKTTHNLNYHKLNNRNCTFNNEKHINITFHYSQDVQSNVRPLKRLLRIISVHAVLDAERLLFCKGHWFQLRLNVMYGRLLKTSTSIAAYHVQQDNYNQTTEDYW